MTAASATPTSPYIKSQVVTITTLQLSSFSGLNFSFLSFVVGTPQGFALSSGTHASQIFDSGASYYITCDASLLTSIDVCTQHPLFHTTNESTLPIMQCGTIIRVTDPFGRLTLSKVFVAPRAYINMISTSYICMMGLTVTFTYTCVMQDPRTLHIYLVLRLTKIVQRNCQLFHNNLILERSLNNLICKIVILLILLLQKAKV